MEENSVSIDENKNINVKNFNDEEMEDYLVQTLGEYALEYLIVKDLQKRAYNNLLHDKVLDMKLYRDYLNALNMFCSDFNNGDFIFEFEHDLNKIWGEEDTLDFELGFIEDMIGSFDDDDKILAENPKLAEEAKFFNSKRFEYLSTSDRINRVREFFKVYNPANLEEIKNLLLNYDGTNTACLIVIEKLSNFGFFDDSPASESKTQTQPE